jgi:predicted dehydrogenase/threonine dehydrogenase-like Zn-dependent dehydrogenase
MKQIVRRVLDRKGRVVVIDLPIPYLESDHVLVQNAYSLISSGTEISTLSKTPIELVRQTLSDPWMRHVVQQTIFSTGLAQTANRIWQEMIMPREIGYSGAGTVLAVGEHVEGFKVGHTVAYAATGHAEIVAPSINHIVSAPEGVDLRHAAFVTVGGIAIQALRRADIQFGEVVTVYGLGLVGQICAMIAKAAGCVVIGIDINAKRNQIAQANGLDLVLNPAQSDLKRRIMDFTGKHGVDATVICASSRSSDIINSSMEITRKQGRVVIVGYVGLDIHPKNFLYREIDLRYSRAYGPGSYHNAYEKGRVDYPFGYVRWTEKRNLEEFIRLLKAGQINVESLIGRSYRVDEAQQAFDDLRSGALEGIAALIDYEADKEPDLRRTLPIHPRPKQSEKVGISIVGVGNHVLGKHLPHLHAMSDVELRGLVSATGKNAQMVAERYKATVITTDIESVLNDQGTDGVMICSSQHKHYQHARQVIEGGKAVFVEKPMVTLVEDFRQLYQLMAKQPVLFTLGLNRRYSSLIQKLQENIEGPVDSVTYTVAVPFVPPDHWTLDENEGGGRLITEGEHFIDLCYLLIGRPALSVYAHSLGKMPDDIRKLCSWAVTIHYEDAVANIIFNESGTTGYPREKITVLARGQVAVLDDFARLTIYGKKTQTFGSGRQADMGHKQQLKEFVAAVRGEPNHLLTWEDASTATLCMFAAQESIRSGEAINLREFRQALTVKHSEDEGSSEA